MKIEDLIKMYEDYRSKFGPQAYKKMSQLFAEAKQIHRDEFQRSTTAKKAITNGREPDHEQSWRAFKGKNLEKLIAYIIKSEVEALGLKLADGNKLERTEGAKLSRELSEVKRSLQVDYGEFGSHLPDVDIVIYDPKKNKAVAAISSKVTLRERIAQTGYWKLKLAADEVTKNIRVYFVTPDEDQTLASAQKPVKKGRAIVETDLDGTYLLCENAIEESNKVKDFGKFIDDLKSFMNERRRYLKY